MVYNRNHQSLLQLKLLNRRKVSLYSLIDSKYKTMEILSLYTMPFFTNGSAASMYAIEAYFLRFFNTAMINANKVTPKMEPITNPHEK